MGKQRFNSFDSNDGSTTSSNKDNPSAFIDHRKLNDLAHIHSSPARTRRRNSTFGYASSPNERRYEGTPLTNNNLRNFNLIESGPLDRTVAIDMDRYTRDQSKYAETFEQQKRYENSIHDYDINDNASFNSLEFGESNPSSDHSSDSTSLDDVCFPEYYDDHPSNSNIWPDLRILQEFIEEETKELGEENNDSDHVNFKYPLENKKVNEVENISPAASSIKVTPTPIQPWDKSNNVFQNKRKQPDYRFTYFREDLSKTIHSPTLSGLLSNNSKIREPATKDLHKKWRDQEDLDNDVDKELSLEDLFQPMSYGNDFRSEIRSPVIGSRLESPVNRDSKADLKDSHEEMSQVKNLLAKQLTDTPKTDTITDSVLTERVNPFWLDVLNPTEEEMKVLSKTFGIHPLTTEDIFLGEAREKVELFKSYYFICFTSFDIVYERRKQLKKEHERKLNKMAELQDPEMDNFIGKIKSRLFPKPSTVTSKSSSSMKSTGKKIREGELSPLSMYMIIFKDAVITFHFSATPHPINVRRRARILKDYLTVSSDWISYALIDDITDSFAPMIESIEDEVNSIEEAILRMHAGDNDSDTEDESESEDEEAMKSVRPTNIFYKRSRSKSTVGKNGYMLLDDSGKNFKRKPSAVSTTSKSKSKTSKSSSKILGWKRKGDMLRRIGECRKRVMSVLRLLGSKADVIKGFNKRLNEGELHDKKSPQSRQEITMYLGDIQDHIITMVQSLNHYEKLLARFHSNYLAQINIDMTKVNNDTNDVLGKITILGTIVLPINVVTGLWGMNVIVPGQEHPGLIWFFSIVGSMVIFSFFAYFYAKRAYGL